MREFRRHVAVIRWKTFIACLLVVVLAAAACGVADQDGAFKDWSGTRQDVNGVEVVRNPESPLTDASAVVVRRLWAAPSPSEERSKGVWEEPVAVRVAQRFVVVLDRMAHRIHVVDRPSGRWRQSLGREGEGPGEFQEPFGIAVQDDEIVVGNGGDASLERFGVDGEFRGTVRFGEMGFSIHGLGPDGFLVSSLVGREGGWKRVSPEGEITTFPWPEDDGLAMTELSDDCMGVSAAGSTVLRFSCRELAFQVIDSEGTLQRAVLVEGSLEPPSESAIEAHLDEVRTIMQRSGLPPEMIDQQVEGERERLRRNPRMRALRVDPETGYVALWEQRPADLGPEPAQLHIFSSDGIYLARVAFEQAWVDFDWDDGKLYALVRDPESDLVRLFAYAIDLTNLDR